MDGRRHFSHAGSIGCVLHTVDQPLPIASREATMCFIHSGSTGNSDLVQRAVLGEAAAAAFGGVAAGTWSIGMDVAGSGAPDVVAGAERARVLDGYNQVLHNRWNRDLPPAVTVRPGEVIQLLCRDALDIGEAGRTLTPEGTLTLDLGRVHPLTGPVQVEGAEPGDILEVEILDVSPLVDFGYVVISPVLGLFGSLRHEPLAALTSFTEASALSDPSPGRVPGALPAGQPHNSGAPLVQLFTFERGQSTGLAAFTGADTGQQARIPVSPV